MRVYDQNLTGTSGAQAGRTQETQKADRTENARSGSAGSSGPVDRVEFSSAMGTLSRAMSAHESSRASHVQALAAQYQSGSYRPDSAATSRAMVSESLAGGIQ